jgi:hypothetical protein
MRNDNRRLALPCCCAATKPESGTRLVMLVIVVFLAVDKLLTVWVRAIGIELSVSKILGKNSHHMFLVAFGKASCKSLHTEMTLLVDQLSVLQI